LEYWTISFDESLLLQGTSEGILVTSPKGDTVKYVLQMHFLASNNATEYEALLHCPRIAMALSVRWLKVLGDLMLVIYQANNEWPCLDGKIMMYCQEPRKLENNFDGLEYLHILRGQNEVADELVMLSSNRAMIPQGVLMQELQEPSISKVLSKAIKSVESFVGTTSLADDKPKSSDAMMVYSDWRTQFMIYHKTGGLLSYPVLCQNQVLIICMTQDQLFHTYSQKCSQITKCHK
jgi:hypothetical protein